MTGGESWWRLLWRFAKYVVVCFGLLAGAVVLVLWLKGALSLHALSLGFYFAGGLVAAGFVFVMLRMNSAVGTPGLTPPRYAYYPLDTDFALRRKSDEMQELAPLVFTLLALFWGGGFLLELLA